MAFAYLSRPQIYRALLKGTSALNAVALSYLGAIPTNPEFVFPHLGMLGADRELPENAALAQQEMEAISGGDEDIDWHHRLLGADNLNAGTNADNADINDSNTSIRQSWFDHLVLINLLIGEI